MPLPIKPFEHYNNAASLINEYLQAKIKHELDLEINLTEEFVLHHDSPVEGKFLIIPTYSDQILNNQSLQLLLDNIFLRLNNGELSLEDVQNELSSL